MYVLMRLLTLFIGITHMTIRIRPETKADISQIREVVYQAFLNHPHHAIGALPTEHLIIEGLRNTGELTLSLVAEMDNVVCAHLAFSKIMINHQFLHWYGLGPVAVLPEMQNQGIGSSLIREGIATMRANGAAGLVLLGDPRYYQRFGFKANGALTLKGVPAEYFMSLAFIPDLAAGEVDYHASFGNS